MLSATLVRTSGSHHWRPVSGGAGAAYLALGVHCVPDMPADRDPGCKPTLPPNRCSLYTLLLPHRPPPSRPRPHPPKSSSTRCYPHRLRPRPLPPCTRSPRRAQARVRLQGAVKAAAQEAPCSPHLDGVPCRLWGLLTLLPPPPAPGLAQRTHWLPRHPPSFARPGPARPCPLSAPPPLITVDTPRRGEARMRRKTRHQAC